jgi:antitoxin component YwqK of YwqJK toxin-antitoxin module
LKKYTIPQGIEVNGLKQGLWINYNSIGFLQNIETYVDGLVQGETVTYNEHGIIVQKAEVHQGKFRGKFECYSGKGFKPSRGYILITKK